MLTGSNDPKIRNPQDALAQVKELYDRTPESMSRGKVSKIGQRMAFLVLQDLHSVCLSNTGAYDQAMEMSQSIIKLAKSQQAPPAFMDELRNRNRAIASKRPIIFDFKVPIPPGY